MGIPTLVRQRPGWWTQFGRSLLSGVAGAGLSAGEAALRGLVQNYFQKQLMQERDKQLKAQQEREFAFRQQRAKEAFERNRQLAQEAAQRRRFEAIPQALMGSGDPKVAAQAAKMLLMGRKYEAPIPAPKGLGVEGPYITKESPAREKVAPAAVGYAPPPPEEKTYPELGRQVGRYMETLPGETFQPRALQQIGASQQLAILKHKLRMAEIGYRSALSSGRQRDAALYRAELENLKQQAAALLGMTRANVGLLYGTNPESLQQKIDTMAEKTKQKIAATRKAGRTGVLPKPRAKKANVPDNATFEQVVQEYMSRFGYGRKEAEEAARLTMEKR